VEAGAVTWASFSGTGGGPASPGIPYLLPSGKVLIADMVSLGQWWTLTPDPDGRYVTGHLERIADSPVGRIYFCGGVDLSGNVIMCGGEYSTSGVNGTDSTSAVQEFDTASETWKTLRPPLSWQTNFKVGDGSGLVLADGTYLTSCINSNVIQILSASGTWTSTFAWPGTSPDEGTWVRLRSGAVIAIETEVTPSHGYRFRDAANGWVDCGATNPDIADHANAEMGAGLMLADGRVIFVGALGKSTIYTEPVVASDPGSFAAGPVLPMNGTGDQYVQEDAPAVLMPSGKSLWCAATITGPYDGCHFFELDALAAGPFVEVSRPAAAAGEQTFVTMLLQLPDGDVLWTTFAGGLQFYTPGGSPDPSWAPTIASAPSSVTAGESYGISGTQFAGLGASQGYGDDYTAATGYPLVRATHVASGRVQFWRTSGYSTLAYGPSVPGAATFHVPLDARLGDTSCEVVVNGIASAPFLLTVAPMGAVL
jgi:hypothetical protein